MNSTDFPAFESLPAVAQERIGGLAQRFGVTNQQALMVVILIGQGVPMMKLAASCREGGVPLSMTDLEAIRHAVDGWVSLEDHRKAILARLEQKGLLTEERRERIAKAATKREVMAVYCEAVPLEPVAGQQGAGGPIGPVDLSVDPFFWVDILLLPEVIRVACTGVASVVKGAGELISEAWDQVDISSIWD